MNCQKAGSLISAYLDRELSPEERRQLRLHLMECSECSDELQELEKIKGVLGYLTVTRVPAIIPWLRAQLVATNMGEPPVALAWQSPWFRRTCAAAALLLLFGLSSILLLPQHSGPGPVQRDTAPSLPNTSWVSAGRILP